MTATGSTVWFGGRIWTGHRYVERVIADGGRVVAAGNGPAGGAEVPTGAERVDLGGRIATPGLLDAHLHLTDAARAPAGVALGGARSFADLAERVRAGAARSAGPLWGGGWDDERLAERRRPTRRDLDAWVPDRAVALTRVCGHVVVVNSAALERLGIDRSTPDPPGGTIEREADGAPSGILRERALGWLRKFPYPTLSERPELGRAFLASLRAVGIVGYATMRAPESELRWLAEGAEPPAPRGLLFGNVDDVRDVTAWARRRDRDPRVVGIKLFADGSFGGRGAWLRAPYDDAPGTTGGPLLAPGDWAPMIREADALGLRVAAHAIGDAGIDAVLRGFELARPTLRHRLEHAGLVPPDLQERLARLPLDVVVQPGFRTSDGWLPERLGPDRVRYAYPWRSLADRGVRLAGSSDAPVEPIDPIVGIRAAVRTGVPGEALSREEALALYTTGASSTLGQPDLGHLEPGARASLVVWEARSLDGLFAEGGSVERMVWIDGAASR